MDVDGFGAAITQARMLLQQGNPDAAAESFDSLRLAPIVAPEELLQFSILALELERPKDARTRLRRLARRSRDPQVWLLLGIASLRLGENSDSIRALQQALKLRPNWSDAAYNLSRAYEKRGQLDAALATVEAALQENPADADLCNQRGLVLAEQGHWEESLAAHLQASELEPADPGFRYNAAETLLRLGRTQAAWPLFDARLQLSHARFPDTTAPRWAGESLAGRRVLVWNEQGLGDLLFALRCGPALAAAGASLIVRAPRPLLRLLEAQPWISQTCDPSAACPEVDVHLPALDLIKHPLTAEVNGPHLSPPPELKDAVRSRVSGSAPKIGWIWRGNPKHRDDAERSIPESALRKALQSAGAATHVSLQHFAADERKPNLPELIDLGDELGDFLDTAAWMRELDHVVSVDTASIHLAAGLGCPATLLLSRPGDWRWGIPASKPAGYTQLTVHQQENRGAWAPVLKRTLRTLVP